MSVQPNNLLAKTAGIFENFFNCCAGARTVQDDATAYTFPELPASIVDEAEYYLREDRQDTAATAEDEDDVYNLKASCSASTSDKAIACTDSFVSKKSSTANGGGGGSIVFLDAMEPRIRPVLHFPASASIKTATTASMSSTHSFYTIPTIQGSRTFDSECSLASSTATTQVARSTSSSCAQRSISSATTAKVKTPGCKRYRHCNHDGIGRQLHDDKDKDGQHSMRSVQTQGLPHLPVLSATDGYRC